MIKVTTTELNDYCLEIEVCEDNYKTRATGTITYKDDGLYYAYTTVGNGNGRGCKTEQYAVQFLLEHIVPEVSRLPVKRMGDAVRAAVESQPLLYTG